jgi:L-ascorbate metabolism protein UlaG (beta-lactamase superfamily)
MKLRLIRHATLLLDYAGKKILVDPMFAPQGEFAGLPAGRRSGLRNPLVDLPCAPDELGTPDLAVLTHLHFDHLDKAAAAWLSPDVPLVCQSGDDVWLERRGFRRVNGLHKIPLSAQGVRFVRTDGRHGGPIVGRLAGYVSGFVLSAPGEPVLYIAGDTVWCRPVAEAIKEHRPEVIVLNAGAARFTVGGHITMDARDVIRVCRAAPQSRIVAVHMEAVNHCRLMREGLAAALERAGLAGRVAIPADGETISV